MAIYGYNGKVTSIFCGSVGVCGPAWDQVMVETGVPVLVPKDAHTTCALSGSGGINCRVFGE